MTAEIVIMNKEAVAVAADSAVTISEGYPKKILVSANKVFALSKYHPVCIMVYGIATFMGLPWETIIKIFRSSMSREGFKTLQEYADRFLGFLDSNEALFPQDAQLDFFRASVRACYALIRSEIEKAAQNILKAQGPIGNEEQVAEIVRKTIEKHLGIWEAGDGASGLIEKTPEDLGDQCFGSIAAAREEIFHKLPISPSDSASLNRIALSSFTKFPESITKPTSGIVIAGFGEGDIFPALRCFTLHGILNNRLRYKEDEGQKIDVKISAAILPFAQSEMVATFMEGVDPRYQGAIEDQFSRVLDEYPGLVLDQIEVLGEAEKNALKGRLSASKKKMLADYGSRLREYRKRKHVDPVLSAVAYLPKDELATMAESLVRLTSFKRKVTMEAETVAEPIDVAVISKGDGFIWMKRKHYFQRELNPQFFANYYREDRDGQKEE